METVRKKDSTYARRYASTRYRKGRQPRHRPRLKKALEQADLAGGKTGKIPIVTFEEGSGGKGENLKGVLIEMKAFVYLLNFLMKPVIDKIEEEDIRGNDDNARSTTPTE